ncbi:MAG TPA: hypothetical protein VIY08_12145 [Candidatus Nitrosocosmicus sp.]
MFGWGVTIEFESKEIFGIIVSKERHMFVTEHFLSDILEEYGWYPISTTDDGTLHPQICHFLKMKYYSFLLGEKHYRKVLYSISRKEPNDLTITFHTKRKNIK